MPKDVVFWICVIAAVFVLGALAIWKWGKNITLKAGPLSFGTSDRNAAASASDPVTVGKKAAVDGSVGEIIGRTVFPVPASTHIYVEEVERDGEEVLVRALYVHAADIPRLIGHYGPKWAERLGDLLPDPLARGTTCPITLDYEDSENV